MLRAVIAVDGSYTRGDLSLHDQLRQRAAMGGPKERAELANFEKLLTRVLADALVADLRQAAAAEGLAIRTSRNRKDDNGE